MYLNHKINTQLIENFILKTFQYFSANKSQNKHKNVLHKLFKSFLIMALNLCFNNVELTYYVYLPMSICKLNALPMSKQHP